MNTACHIPVYLKKVCNTIWYQNLEYQVGYFSAVAWCERVFFCATSPTSAHPPTLRLKYILTFVESLVSAKRVQMSASCRVSVKDHLERTYIDDLVYHVRYSSAEVCYEGVLPLTFTNPSLQIGLSGPSQHCESMAAESTEKCVWKTSNECKRTMLVLTKAH